MSDMIKLTDIINFVGGSQPPKSSFSDVKKDGYIRLIQIRDYKSDNHIVYIKKDSTKKFCTEDDIMIGRYGPPVFQILRGLSGAYNVALMKAEPKTNNLSKEYLFRFLQSPSIQNYIIALSQRAAGQSGVNKTALEEYEIILPSLPEQQRIVSKLDLLFEKIDKSIALHQKNMDEAKAFMDSVLNDVFVELEEKYEKVQLKNIVNNHDGKRVPLKSTDRESMQGKYPYYGASGIIDYINDYIFDGEYLLISEDGANLTVRKYPIAFIAKGKFWVNNHAHIVKAKDNISTNKFMEYAFAYTNISVYITGSAQPKMSQGKMNIIEFSIPPLPIQQKVVNYLDEISQKIEKIKSIQKEKTESLKALKASILDQAFRGEL